VPVWLGPQVQAVPRRPPQPVAVGQRSPRPRRRAQASRVPGVIARHKLGMFASATKPWAVMTCAATMASGGLDRGADPPPRPGFAPSGAAGILPFQPDRDRADSRAAPHDHGHLDDPRRGPGGDDAADPGSGPGGEHRPELADEPARPASGPRRDLALRARPGQRLSEDLGELARPSGRRGLQARRARGGPVPARGRRRCPGGPGSRGGPGQAGRHAGCRRPGRHAGLGGG
jgi:hypothetical protein